MKLTQVSLKGFRSYNDRTIIDIEENLTSIIGRNDIGKSTILEALEIFFNNDTVKIDKNDLCIHSSGQTIEISCAFKNFPSELVLDSSSNTNLEDEHLLNKNGQFEVVKIYDCSKSALKPATFCRALYPSDDRIGQLHSLKNADLKNVAERLGIIDQVLDKRSNVSLRKTIFEFVDSPNILKEQLVSLDKEDGKKVYDKIKGRMPLNVLFQSDRTSNDEDSEVQDPMKIAVKQAIQEVQADLDTIKERVQQKAQESALRTLNKLNEMNPDLANDLQPIFRSEPKWDTIFKLSLTDDDSIPINKRGSGTRRLILLNFFRAEAERKQLEDDSPSIIYAIEEPETSQHPDNQHKLIKALQDLSLSSNCQVVLTTHVPRLAGLVDTGSLRFIVREATEKKVYNNCDEEVLSKVADTLGVLPDRRVQVILFVEGPSDIDFFEAITPTVLALDNSLPDLVSDHRIAMFPLGGSTLKQWVTKHYTKSLKVDEVHVYDRDDPDDPKYKSSVDEVNNREDNCCAFLTQKREIENYVHPRAIEREFDIYRDFGEFDDVPFIIASELNKRNNPNEEWSTVGKSRRKRFEGQVKQRITKNAAAQMSPDELSEIDKHAEILGWFSQIRTRLS